MSPSTPTVPAPKLVAMNLFRGGGRSSRARRPRRLPVISSDGVSSIIVSNRRRPRGRAAWGWTEKRRELDWIQDYLTISDAGKGRDIATRDPWVFAEWARNNSWNYPRSVPEWLDARVETLAHAGNYEALGKLLDKIPDDTMRAFFGSPEAARYSDHSDSPSYVHMDFTARHPRQWLVHFTDNAADVACGGFQRGVSNFEELGLTTHFTDEYKDQGVGTYNFAYDADYAERAARSRHGQWKYGQGIVMFTAPSVEVTHFGDEEQQWIFWGPDARQLVLVSELDGQDGRFCVGENRHGDPLFCAEHLEDVADWLEDNYRQYKRHLSCGGTQPSEDREHRSGRRRGFGNATGCEDLGAELVHSLGLEWSRGGDLGVDEGYLFVYAGGMVYRFYFDAWNEDCVLAARAGASRVRAARRGAEAWCADMKKRFPGDPPICTGYAVPNGRSRGVYGVSWALVPYPGSTWDEVLHAAALGRFDESSLVDWSKRAGCGNRRGRGHRR